jgi:Domain of unknown function (DUF4280)
MSTYLIKKGDTFESIANNINLTDPEKIRDHHNESSAQKDVVGFEPEEGKTVTLPSEEKVESYNQESSKKEQQQKNKKAEQKEKEEEKPEKSEHDSKHFVIQKGKACCDKGDKFPNFKVTSHDLHYWNSKTGDADNIAVTDADVMFNPPGPSFGQCKLKPTSGGYLPCAFAPAGKWTKTYKKTKIMGNSCLTELSELMCATGGKITVKKHGQESESSSSNLKGKPSKKINPLVDMEEFQEEINDEPLYN